MIKPARVYYHLSKTPGLQVLEPRYTKESFATKHEAKAFRVCVSSSIIGCLSAIQPDTDDEYFVYSVLVGPDTAFIPNKYVRYLVPDADITKECWIMDSIWCLCEGKIVVTDAGYGSKPKWRWLSNYRKPKEG